jgi:peptidoglycan/LPS O-acetylase OafA/YrhL
MLRAGAMTTYSPVLAQRSATGGHLTDLDGIRGLLAVAVMLYHFGLNTVIARVSGGVFPNVHWELSVDFFYILSGFVLAISFTRRPVDLPRFAMKRVVRLLPVHLAIFCIFFPALYYPYKPDSWTIAANLVLIQPFLGLPSLNPPSWSAGLELFVPLIAVIAWVRLFKLREPLKWLLFVLFLAGSAWCHYRLALGEQRFVLRAIFGLGLGFMLFALLGKVPEQKTGLPRSIATITALALTISTFFASSVVPQAALLFAPLAVATILLGARSTSLFSSQIAQWGGTRSYTIYMVHFPVLLAGVMIFGEASLQGNIGLKVGLVGLSLVLADVLTRFVELPGMRLGKVTRRPARA